MKKRNTLHFVEFALLSPLFFFLAFFLKMRGDLFFTFTLIFSVIATLMQLVYLYIAGDNERHINCRLIPVDISDVIFLYYLLQNAFSIVFLVLHNLSDFAPWTAFAVYFTLLALSVLVMVVPAPKDPVPPAPINELDDVSEKKLRYYANYLRKLCGKCEYAPLNTVMTEIADLLPRLDSAFSVQLQTLENDLSSKSVKVENALLTGDHTRLPLLAREMEATLQYMQKRIEDYRFTLTDEGFYHEDDEIAMRQIDLLLDKLGLEYEEDLATASAPFENEFFYRKALKFASEQYRTLLEGYNRQIIERLENEKNTRILRREHRMRFLHQGCHMISVVLIASLVIIPLLWHFVIQPQGLITQPDENGNLIITGYNPFYSDDLVIPATLKGKKVIAVGENALKSSDLTSLTLEEGVERLDYQSVRDSVSLTTIYLPKSLNLIGNYALYETDSLQVIHYAGSEADWKNIKIGVNGNKPLKSVKIEYAE
ncbi:MAG: leucine-rich repeat protein [Clostridia bacterium]|nr:leucine-rich repeat protein [Clostridia bacterium]